MNVQAWIALGMLAAVVIGGVLRVGRDMGEIKGGISELLGRAERTDKSVDRVEGRMNSLETRVNDHTERLARLEGREEA